MYVARIAVNRPSLRVNQVLLGRGSRGGGFRSPQRIPLRSRVGVTMDGIIDVEDTVETLFSSIIPVSLRLQPVLRRTQPVN